MAQVPHTDDAPSTPVPRRRPDDGGSDGAPPIDELLELLDDEYARAVLEAIESEAKAAREIVAACDASRPTVYRRLNRLEDAGLVDTRTTYDPDGHHRQVYRARVEEVTLRLGPDGLDAEVTLDGESPRDAFVDPTDD
jgi:DNA-binding transcriptional ArsR family regulator